ncbi:hypothetical protein CVT26_003342 [Gymnopilus dilepis]|uniref:Cytochrome P450 n=1 Tax=Gymnopilus dilepis TaxID=231916 RepID=A0A409W2V7_9AGAR|nr:hypothetical protein CVT26_003342 [Gymnopilus dilepis]
MITYLSAVAVVLAAWLVKKVIETYTKDKPSRSYPPGPRPRPLIGNILDLPTTRGPEVYVEWGKKYHSDVLFAKTPLSGVLILNKQEDADELFERRSRIYSDRPNLPILELIGWEWNIALLRYGPWWKFQRQICQQNFRAEAARDYHPLLLDKVHGMCQRLLEAPENFDEHNRWLSISLPMGTMYGYNVKSFEDPCISAADEGATAAAALLLPGATLVNIIPPLAKIRIPTWLPGASTWKTAKKLRELSDTARSIPYDFVKKSMTIAATSSFIYLMAIHPEVQRKAQAEIDEVVGQARLPDFDDRPKLPYIEAIYREVLRINPPVPLGLPHGVTEDDNYKGYFIPKGTVVLANIWGMTHNEDVYSEPFKFKPERFLDEKGDLNEDGRVLAYGFGRRVCVGKHVASATQKNMGPYFPTVAAILVIWLFKKIIASNAQNASKICYPPGPRPLPLIGNIFDLPTMRAPEIYLEWGRKYQSDILFASTPNYGVLILNKQEDADELLERRSRKYSDRPDVPVLKLIGWEWNVALLRYGPSWRFHRHICQEHFRARAAPNYHPLLLNKIHEMCSRLLAVPENFDEHNRWLSMSVPMITMYGYDVQSSDDPFIAAAEEGLARSGPLLLPAGTLVNIIPPLANLRIPTWVPGAKTWNVAKRLRELSDIGRQTPYEYVKAGMAEGTAVDSFVSRFLKKREEYGVSESEEKAIQNIAMTVYAGASDTTFTATRSFLYHMTMHPEIQKKAQAEIDAVVGNTRLPDFDDRPSLPYIEAIYREVLRIDPPAPTGVPHAATEDDYYKGYFIPKGTVVFPNIWAMTHDEDVYPEASKFKPERFLDENGYLKDDMRVLAYGFGRRICVGRHVASATMWMIIASILACFDIKKSKDEHGKDIDISDEYDDSGFARPFVYCIDDRHKEPFQCTFAPRSHMVKQLLQDKDPLSL